MHAPPDEQPSPVVPHDWQVWPPAPHALPVGGSVHTFPVQQPVMHDPGVHSHDPLTQTWPDAHAAPAPQRHPPEGEQLSACALAHWTHALPSVPQLVAEVGVTQSPSVQHPVGQEAELHTQWPPTHC
jgi:hypothetical protein